MIQSKAFIDEFAQGLVFYGAGANNLLLAWIPTRANNIPIISIADNNKDLQGTSVFGIDIISPDDLRKFDREIGRKYPLVLTIRTPETAKEVIASLSDLENASIYSYDNYLAILYENYEAQSLPDICCLLTTHCNLNCVRCSFASPLCKDTPEFLDEAKFERELSRLSELKIDNYLFELLGGEPLLHPNVHKFPYIVKKYYPDTQVNIVTNGILLPKMSDSFFASCRDCNVEIVITHYPIGLDYSELYALLKDKGVRCRTQNNLDRPKEMWKSPIVPNKKDKKIDADYSFRHCELRAFILRDGIIYPCPSATISQRLNATFGLGLPECADTGVDIFAVKSREELLKKVSEPSAICAYCDIDRKNEQPVSWSVSKCDLGEWVIE